MMISRELEATLSLAVREATRRKHEFLTLEHVLFALLHDADVEDVVRHCGGDPERLRAEVDRFLESSMETVEVEELEPQQTLGFRRILERAALHVQSSGKDQIRSNDVLVSLFRETDSHAAFLLEKEGVSRYDVVSYISHGVSKLEDQGGRYRGAGRHRRTRRGEAAEAARGVHRQPERTRRRRATSTR